MREILSKQKIFSVLTNPDLKIERAAPRYANINSELTNSEHRKKKINFHVSGGLQFMMAAIYIV